MTDPLPRLAGPIVLRRLAPTDLQAFQAYRQDAELGRYQGWVATPDADAREFLGYMNRAELLQPGIWCQIGIAEAGTLELIGDIGLILAADGSQAEVGFTLGRPSQGRGLATAAVREAIALVFEQTSAGKVVASADERNSASVRLLERVGMRRVEARAARSRGEAYTELVYALARHGDRARHGTQGP